MSELATVTVSAAALRDLVRTCFERTGLAEPDAEAVADALLYANLRGIDSHGIDRVPVYLRRVRAGVAGGTDRMRVVARHGALCRVDAGHALGPAAAVRAMDMAMELASELGVGMVALGRSTNMGAAGFYALRAAERGFAGLVTTNAPKLMAPHGAAEPFLGSNPVAIAVPMGGRDAFVLDMSTTVIARGKVRRAGVQGRSIPPGVALDADGRPTTDADEAMAGSMLPLGGAKGSGLAIAVMLLGALLADADFDDEVASIYADAERPQNLGQLFLAIDPWRVADPEIAAQRMEGVADRLHGLRPQEGADAVRYPGEASAERARLRTESGIPVPCRDLEAIADAAEDCGLPDLVLRARELAGATPRSAGALG